MRHVLPGPAVEDASILDFGHSDHDRAGFEARFRDRLRAVTVGVGLHHGNDVGLRPCAYRLDVRRDGVEVDVGHGRADGL